MNKRVEEKNTSPKGQSPAAMAKESETLQTYLTHRRDLTKKAFMQRFNHPFLVEELVQRGSGEKNFEFATLQISKEEVKSLLGLTPGGTAKNQVRRVVKRASNAFEGMINVGRAGNNDVVLDYQAISKFHAYFTKDPSGDIFYVTDADSTNGTFVNGQQLQPHQKHRLSEGDVLSFARQAELRYYSSGGFYEMLSLLVG